MMAIDSVSRRGLSRAVLRIAILEADLGHLKSEIERLEARMGPFGPYPRGEPESN